jgi:hypothetical protein
VVVGVVVVVDELEAGGAGGAVGVVVVGSSCGGRCERLRGAGVTGGVSSSSVPGCGAGGGSELSDRSGGVVIAAGAGGETCVTGGAK